MRLTQTVGYAAEVLIRVDELGGKQPVTAAQICRGAKFPPRFLYRVLRMLVRGGLLSAVPGPGGGYTLAQKLSSIKMLDVALAVDGLGSETELRAAHRKNRGVIALINEAAHNSDAAFRRDLSRISLAKLRANAS